MAMYEPLKSLNRNDIYQGLVDQLNLQKKMQQEKYLKEMEAKQRASEAAETAKYHQGMLGISQSAENRLQKMSPYEIQKAQAEINKSQQEQSIMKDILNGGSSQANEQTYNGGASAGSPVLGGGGPPNADQMSKQDLVNNANQNTDFFKRQQMQQGGMPERQNLNAPQQPSLENLQMGERMVLRPAQDPSKAKWDRLAGMKIGNIQIPPIQTRVDNGIEYKTYPSGMTVASKIGSSDIEKEEMKINTKASTDIRKSARELKAMHDRGLKLRKLIEENPNLTGILQGGKAKFNLSDDRKLAEFVQTSRKLQADMARYGSQRGGQQALKWAERAKPSEFRSGKFNMGMLNSIIDDAESDYENLNTEYTDMNKRPLAVKLSSSKKEENKDVINLNGKNYKFENGGWHEVMGGS